MENKWISDGKLNHESLFQNNQKSFILKNGKIMGEMSKMFTYGCESWTIKKAEG